MVSLAEFGAFLYWKEKVVSKNVFYLNLISFCFKQRTVGLNLNSYLFTCALCYTNLINCSGDVARNLDIDVQDTLGHFVVHCHQTRPLLVLGNTDGVGRLKLISSII